MAELFPGLLVPGNIRLYDQTSVRNPDRSHSTLRSMSFNIDGKEVLLDMIDQKGKRLNPIEALNQYYVTKKHLGIFKDPQSASEYAKFIHKEQEQMPRL